jgi:ethanolamine utilization protein EutP (predicted NTPase)
VRRRNLSEERPVDHHEAFFQEKFAEQRARLLKPTILVCGYTGAGKTSLIQAICGRDTVPDDRIGHGKAMTEEFVPYKNDFISLWDSKGFEPGMREEQFVRNVRSLVRRLQAEKDGRDHIHLVWYVVQGPGARVTAVDAELIRSVFDNVIVVITKNDVTRPRQREAITAELVKAGVDPSRILPVSEEDVGSLQALVRLSLEALPEAYKDSFRSAQQVDLSQKRARAQAVIHSAARDAQWGRSFARRLVTGKEHDRWLLSFANPAATASTPTA